VTIVRDVLYGALVTTVCTVLSFILALTGFGRLYYVAVFLPFFMLACLLVAWFLYLKDDGFIPLARTSGVAASASATEQAGSRLKAGGWITDGSSANGPSANGSSANGPAGSSLASGRPDLSLYAPLGEQLVPRQSEGALGHRSAPGARWLGGGNFTGGGKSTGQGSAAGARRALLWAAVQLGLLAAALYSWAGVGAGYFIPVAQ
jgi:hypothetical protein